MTTISLAAALEALRAELSDARAAGAHEDVLFEVGPVQIEFSVVATVTGAGRFGVNFGVVALGADGGRSTAETHRVTVTLTPKDRTTGRAPEVNDEVDALPR